MGSDTPNRLTLFSITVFALSKAAFLWEEEISETSALNTKLVPRSKSNPFLKVSSLLIFRSFNTEFVSKFIFLLNAWKLNFGRFIKTERTVSKTISQKRERGFFLMKA